MNGRTKEVPGACPFDADEAFAIPGGPTGEGNICSECEEPCVHDGVCRNCGHLNRRRRLSELNGLLNRSHAGIERRIDNGRDTLFFYLVTGITERTILMQCSPDDLFDGDGNRFEADLDYAPSPVRLTFIEDSTCELIEVVERDMPKIGQEVCLTDMDSNLPVKGVVMTIDGDEIRIRVTEGVVTGDPD